LWHFLFFRLVETLLLNPVIEIQEAYQDKIIYPNSKVLDVGCGLGEIAHWFSINHFQVDAFDIMLFASFQHVTSYCFVWDLFCDATQFAWMETPQKRFKIKFIQSLAKIATI
jgi:hypothetical protein